MIAVDTNVLLYAQDSREPVKQAKAEALIQTLQDGVLLWQVACEYLAASRKLAPLGYDFTDAWRDLEEVRQVWPLLLPGWSTLERANQLILRYSLSYWDAMIIAACLEAGVAKLYSEDFDAYSRIDSLELINPFK